MNKTFNYGIIPSPLMRAIAFAGAAHANHQRKYSDLAYISHPIAVMELHREILPDYSSPAVLAAAVLHDTVEDTEVEIQDIILHFDHEVAEYVNYLTKISVKGVDGNRNARNAIDRAHFAKGPSQSQNIKLFDVYHNAHDILTTNPRFAVKYIPECIQVVEELNKCDEFAKAQVMDQLIKLNQLNLERRKEAKDHATPQTQTVSC